MTKIKFCGIRRPEEIEAAVRVKPEYIGFVFAPKSRRYVTPHDALVLRRQLGKSDILTVGVFVNEEPEIVARLLEDDVIDVAQLHGREDEKYIRHLLLLTGKQVIKAFRVRCKEDILRAEACCADAVLLDGGAGDGVTFDWDLPGQLGRPYFLAGGLTPENIGEAVARLHPYAVDVSSGIETDGIKDLKKMEAFAAAVRGAK